MVLVDSAPLPDARAFRAAVRRLLRDAGRAPRLLALGEAMHGEEAFPRLRNALFQHLVEQAGYRSIALESSCLRGRHVEAAIQSGTEDLDAVMRQGFSHGFGGSRANRDLVEWMAGYNRSRPAEERLRFLGFDATMEMTSADSPREALWLAHAYLQRHLDRQDLPYTWDEISALIGDDDRWTDPAARFGNSASSPTTCCSSCLQKHPASSPPVPGMSCGTPSSAPAPPPACSDITRRWHTTPRAAWHACCQSATR